MSIDPHRQREHEEMADWHREQMAGRWRGRWRPIDTAPRDGTEVLLTDGLVITFGGWLTDVAQGGEYEGQLRVAGWWSVDSTIEPTHWMPLPDPPAPQDATGEEVGE